MRLIYPVAALVGVLVVSACSHHNGGQYGSGHDANNYTLTYEQVREAAQDGDADAQYALGYMYYYGQNVTRNGKQARFWIGRAASQNHLQAIKALKMMGSESQYANRDNGSHDAQTTPVRNLASRQNSWQEVRRPREAGNQAEQFRPQASNDSDQSSHARYTSRIAAENQQKALANGKTAALSENENKLLRRKHAQADLHKKNSSKTLAGKSQGAHQGSAHATHAAKHLAPGMVKAPTVPKPSAAAAEKNPAASADDAANDVSNPSAAANANSAAVASEEEGTAGPSAAANKGIKNTSQAAPSLQLAQEKNTRPAQNNAKASKALKTAQAHRTKPTLAATHGNQQGSATKGNAQLSSDERSILASHNEHYTLQLIGTSSKATIQHLVAANHLQAKAKIYHSNAKGKDYYVLIYGTYPTQAAATAAIAHLPASIQQLKPWAKPYAAVKASISTVASQQTTKRTS